MITFLRIMQAGGRNFMRNAWLSTAATAVMTVTLAIVMVSFISNVALTSTIKGVTDKIDLSVYLRPDVTDQQVQAFQSALRSNANVASVTYVSKDEALAQYRKANASNTETLKALDITGNILPASVQVKAADPNKLDDIIAIIDQPDNKALLDPNAPPSYTGGRKNTIDRIVNFSDFFRTAGLVASVIFVIISTLIIFNTIRMAIFTRRDEIEIMKLVGATKWFIRGPFIFEAALYGLIAALLTLSVTYAALLSLPGALGPLDLSAAIATFKQNLALVILADVALGILIGSFSSVLALSRYLKL